MIISEFFTEYDEEVATDLNVDPLGLQVIWSVYGQKIFKNRVSSISNDVRNYTINLFHHSIIKSLVESDSVHLSRRLLNACGEKKDSLAFKHACLVFFENLFVYSVIQIGDELKAEADAKAIADKEVADQKAADKKQEDEDKEKARLEGIQAVVDEFEAKQRDLEVESELERLELEQERKLAELGTTVEDLEAKKAIEVFYATLTAEELERIRLQDLADDKAILEAKKIAQMNFVSAVGGVINALGGLAAEGTAAAKTAALADIVINTGLGFAQGLDIAQKGAKATGPAAPFAFPIFYATQIAAVIGAISKAKNILSQVKGGGSGGGAITAPNVAQTPSISSANLDLGVSPETQVAGTAVQAYVVSGDITSSQEAEAKLSTRRAIGG